MESKIRIKLGNIEIEYEGSESFLKEELPDLVATVTELHRASNAGADPEPDEPPARDPATKLDLSTASIATKIGGASGSELAKAAATHLVYVKGQDTFERKELLVEMRTASKYFKDTYSKNFTNTLNTLIKSDFNQQSNGRYAISDELSKRLESDLGI